MDEMIHRGRGLVDLIAGKLPTFSGWDTNPTDAADITDGDITTFCTTGNKICTGGWQFAYLEWDLGALYNVSCSGVLAIIVSASTGRCFLNFWNGSAWLDTREDWMNGSTVKHCVCVGGLCSKVRLGIMSDAAATISPNIREFHVWRLG